MRRRFGLGSATRPKRSLQNRATTKRETRTCSPADKLDDQSERRSLFPQLPHDFGERNENILATRSCRRDKLGCDSAETKRISRPLASSITEAFRDTFRPMPALVVRCGPTANHNEELAVERCNAPLKALKDVERWVVLANLDSRRHLCGSQMISTSFASNPGGRDLDRGKAPACGMGERQSNQSEKQSNQSRDRRGQVDGKSAAPRPPFESTLRRPSEGRP